MADLPAANKKVAVTPTNDTALQDHKGVLIINAGDVAIRFNSGDSPVVCTVPSMSYIPFPVYSIDATNTDATAIFLLL